MVSPGHLDCSGLFIYLLRFKDYHCVGSPPRMRERLSLSMMGGSFLRITPAYAGKTKRFIVSSAALRDHPRVCGKDKLTLKQRFKILGSPPRMRERPRQNATYSSESGITPAYAGKTKEEVVKAQRAGDHPRVCGKDCNQHKWNVRANGITSAYAGKTCL